MAVLYALITILIIFGIGCLFVFWDEIYWSPDEEDERFREKLERDAEKREERRNK